MSVMHKYKVQPKKLSIIIIMLIYPNSCSYP